MQLHPVYKAAMRPAMMFGIPLIPFMLCGGILCIMVSIFGFKWLLAFPVVYLILRMLVEKDEYIFDILYLNLKIKILVLKNNLKHHRKTTNTVVSS